MMHLSQARRKQSILFASLLGFIAAITFSHLKMKPQHEADLLLQALQQVQIGRTRWDELTPAFRGFGATKSNRENCPPGISRFLGHKSPGPPPDVGGSPSSAGETSACTYQAVVTNGFLHRLGMAPITAIVADVDLSRGTVVGIQAFASIGEYGNTADVQFFQVEGHQTDCGQPSCVQRLNASDGAPRKILITVSPAASLAERNRLLGLRTSCFSKIGGCKNVRELLPISADN